MKANGASEKLAGVYAPLVTPFSVGQDLDLPALQHNLEQYQPTGMAGFLVLGSNGENKSLTETEKRRVLEVVEKYKGEKAVMVGVMYEASKLALSFLKTAEACGCDFALVQGPHYFKKLMTDDVLYGYFVEMADASPLPILLYNAPGFTGQALSQGLLRRLAGHPNIVGIKDSSPQTIETLGLIGDRLPIMAGSIGKLFPAMMKGAVGGTVSLANYLPDLAVALWAHGHRKDSEKGASLHETLTTLNGQIAGKYGVAGVKAAMNLSGFRAGIPRRPIVPLDQPAIEHIRRQLDSIS